jgi:hypothetical protein
MIQDCLRKKISFRLAKIDVLKCLIQDCLWGNPRVVVADPKLIKHQCVGSGDDRVVESA